MTAALRWDDGGVSGGVAALSRSLPLCKDVPLCHWWGEVEYAATKCHCATVEGWATALAAILPLCMYHCHRCHAVCRKGGRDSSVNVGSDWIFATEETNIHCLWWSILTKGGDSLKSGLPVTASCNGDGSDRKYALGSQLNLVLDYVADKKEMFSHHFSRFWYSKNSITFYTESQLSWLLSPNIIIFSFLLNKKVKCQLSSHLKSVNI